jgi:micrococcal nuclease
MIHLVAALSLAALACPTGHLHEAHLVSVVDGDTFAASLDLDLGIRVEARVRLLGVDTPEIRDRNPDVRELAVRATAYTRDRLSRGPFVVCTAGADSFGRQLADVYVDGDSLAGGLLGAGLAVPFRR